MRVAVVVKNLNICGGTQKQVLRLGQFLSKNNINYMICTDYYEIDKTYPEFQYLNLKYVLSKTQTHRSFLLKALQHLNNMRVLCGLIPKNVDIINLHDHGLELVALWAKIQGKKVVWQINDLDPAFEEGISKNQKKATNFLRRLLIGFVSKYVDVFTVNVTKNALRVKQHLKREALVYHCGIDTNDNLYLHRYKCHNSISILSIGVLYKYRNYEVLIQVIKKLKSQGIIVRLDIVGNITTDIHYYNYLKDLILENKLTEDIKIWGQVTQEKYDELMNLADIFAFVNIDQSWGLAVFEAMSCGLPVIVSNSVGATELLHDGIDSIVVDPRSVTKICDSVNNLISNPELYNDISQNAAYAAKKYTWDNMYCEKMVQVFQQIL